MTNEHPQATGSFRAEEKVTTQHQVADSRVAVKEAPQKVSDHRATETTGPMYSGIGHTGENIILFVICFAALVAGLYGFGTYPTSGPIGFTIAILLIALAFALPTMVFSSKTNRNVKAEVDQNML